MNVVEMLNKFKIKDFAPLLLLTILALIFFWKVVINPDKIIYSPNSDVIAQFLPWKFFTSQSILEFSQMPFWNPHAFGGAPFFADFLSSIFYPLNLPFYFNYSHSLFGYRFILDALLAGIFMYLFAKEIGLDKKSSIVTAIIFMLASTMVSKIYGGQLPNVDGVSLAPMGFLLVERMLKQKSKYDIVLLSVFFTLYFLASNIQYVLYTSFALLIYFALRLVLLLEKSENKLKTISKMSLKFSLSLILFAGLSAFQLVPSYELSLHTTRSGGVNYEYASDGSFAPNYLITYLIPSFYGLPMDETYWGTATFWEVSGYIGVISLVFVVLAGLQIRNPYVIIMIALSIFSLLFSFGNSGPLFPIFYEYIPFFNMFRFPATYLFITTFSLAILSGFGANVLLGLKPNHAKKIFYLLLISSAIFAVGILTIKLNENFILELGKELGTQKYLTNPNYLSNPLEYYLDKVGLVYNRILAETTNTFLLLSAATIAFLFRILKKIDNGMLVNLLMLLVVIDLFAFGSKFIDVADPKEIFSIDKIVSFLKNDQSIYRVNIINNTILPEDVYLNNLRGVRGYNVIQLKNYSRVLDAGGIKFSGIDGVNSLKLLGIMNTKYVISDSRLSLSGLEEVFAENGKYVYSNRYFLPMAFTAFNYEVLDDEQILYRIKSGDIDSKVALLNEPPRNIISVTGSGDAKITYYSPNEIKINVDMTASGLLVLSDNYYPGWNAHVDGTQTQILRAYNVLKAIYLYKGQHEVTFSFYPTNLDSLTMISLLTLMGIVGYHIAGDLGYIRRNI